MAKQAQLDEVRPALNKVNKGVSKMEKVLDAVEAGADKATDILEDGLETVADIVPEALDKSVYVAAEGTRKGLRFISSPKKLAVLIAVGGALAGAGLGVGAYFLLKKQLSSKIELEFEAKLDAEIEGMRKFYERRTKTGKYATPESAAETLIPDIETALVEEAVEALATYEPVQPTGIIPSSEDPRLGANNRTRYDRVKEVQPEAVVETVAVVEEITLNVFDAQQIDGWDMDVEEASRRPEAPYVISHDEFMENSYEHQQNTITYYLGDDTLADENSVAIDEVEATVGVENLQRFGHGSRDSSIVYVRNERIELDFEVILNRGTYLEEIVGFQHSEITKIRTRRGRRGDDG